MALGHEMGASRATEGAMVEGRVAIVTGSGRGIGQAMAVALAKAGAAVGLTARSKREIEETAATIESSGGRAVAVPADVTKVTAVDQMVREVEAKLGPVDLLVNNAGVSFQDRARPSWELPPELWWEEVEVNLRGPYLCARAVLPGMVSRRRGCIINVASLAALRAPRGAAYGVSKTALTRWTEGLGTEARPFGVAVVAMEPGFVRTAMVERAIAHGAAIFRQSLDTGGDMPASVPADLVVQLASVDLLPLTGRFFCVGDDVKAKLRQAEEIVQQDLYTLRMGALASQPLVPWAAKAGIRSMPSR